MWFKTEPLEGAEQLWQKLPEDVRGGFDAVAMDIWDAFITSTKNHAPQAEIVHDKFHISEYLNEAVDKVRQADHKSFMKDGDEKLKGANANARGYRNFANYRVAILFYCGKLEFHPL
jgi:transposase